MNTSFDAVVQYVWNVLQELLPKQFFGSNRNKNVFRSKLKHFVECSRHDVVRLQQLTMSLNQVTWVGYTHVRRQKLGERTERSAIGK